MHQRVFEPVGMEIRGLALRRIASTEIVRLRELLGEHGVLVFPEQHLDDAAFVAFLTAFGSLTRTAGEPAVPGFPDLNAVSNVGRTTPPRSTFHVDTSYVRHPPAYTALRAVQIPAGGGETLFTNQYRAAETLPSELAGAIAGRTIRHVVTGVDPGPGEETAADHPALRPHPLTGRTALYLSTPRRCAAVSGLGEQEGRQLVDELFRHSTREDNVFRHAWARGDVVMWDNGCVLHRADHDRVIGDRVMHRGMVAGYGAG
ncbi:TauD/TfdA dioxygenase family protein [Amycolatopsis sp. cmx-4-83]|uniref:TauD/TfdA dioxygenase family protein n=1 Tax=Amycolatopsis sp. cmx-4-83 TaxID=2790940 RepID=UPI00397C0C98